MIDDVSRKIVEEKLADVRYSKPIHERLYELNKEILDKKEMQRHMEMEKFRAQASQILESGGSAKKRENLE
jgi:ABC-type oligopeptide transport system ATPase subunit